MQDYGYLYKPYTCMEKKCNLHVALHGCGDDQPGSWILPYDYTNYAASNDIVLLFPFAKACWDIRAQTGAMYGTKVGVQMKALKAMIDKIVIENDE